MWSLRSIVLLLLLGCTFSEREEDSDVSDTFVEAARALFADQDAVGGLRSVASAFVESDAGKQVVDIFAGGNGKGLGKQLMSGIGSLLGGQDGQGGDFSMLATIFDSLTSETGGRRSKRSVDGYNEEPGFNLDGILNVANSLVGQNANSEILMGIAPMLLENLGSFIGGGSHGPTDHSGHSWFMPPILENIHVMWDHFSNSELGQTLYKKSGLSAIVTQLSNENGTLHYQRFLDSFENPTLRTRWIKSLTNFVAEWISHVSDPMIQQRYLTAVQFVGNSFLKTQGIPKSALFDSSRPADSISRLVNALARRHLGMKIDSSQYIRPAVSYIQELVNLASEKGFIMSRVNARELSKRLSDTINYDLIGPVLKAYRAYKWAMKTPPCAMQILCTINEKNAARESTQTWSLRRILAKVSSFPAAWAVSNGTGINFWSLYGAIMEQDSCIEKFPAECTAFHEEEIRVTTESVHSEL